MELDFYIVIVQESILVKLKKWHLASLKNRTNTDVYILSPIWNPHVPPIKFIIHMRAPPIIELKINFKIHLIGTINILPIIKNIHIQEIIIRVFIST